MVKHKLIETIPEEEEVLPKVSQCFNDHFDKLKTYFPSIMSRRSKGEDVVKGKEDNSQKKQSLEMSVDSAERLPSTLRFNLNFELDIVALFLFVLGLGTRLYQLREPHSIVFDELHYGKYVSMYMKRTFFYDAHPPLGKQLIAGVAYLTGFDGNYTFGSIGGAYTENVPVFAMRLVPAVCGSLIIPAAYHLMIELGFKQWTAIIAGFLLLCDNALLTQSRFVLMEPMLLCFSIFGILCLVKFRRYQTQPLSADWWGWLVVGIASLTCAMCVKHVGILSYLLGLAILTQAYWRLLSDKQHSDLEMLLHFIARMLVVVGVSVGIYLSVFYVHFAVLTKAGPHDSVMTSAFQASLEGGLASITKGQPLEVAHGSQITLRHAHGTPCWLHSHAAVYPVLYPDKRGSSHQQQVTCYTYKDVNNWWLVKRPERNDIVVSEPLDKIKHGDIIQLVHGITNRALNSHDVAGPMTPNNQEVSCYIDYNITMEAQNLWRVEITNHEQVGEIWHTIESLVRLVHVNTSAALKFSGRQLPDWGFNQHEIVADKVIKQNDNIWNVEEHRYTRNQELKDREKELVMAEMIPMKVTAMSFWDKLMELQWKMWFATTEKVQNHMYSSDPFEWPMLTRGMAYWVSSTSNAQIHLLGNIMLWRTGALGLVVYCGLLAFYLLRRRRQCYDISEENWESFKSAGEILLGGFLFHFVPYFFVDQTLFLHHYLPAFIFKVLLLSALIEHLYKLISGPGTTRRTLGLVFNLLVGCWLLSVLATFREFSVLSYGTTPLSADDVRQLRWLESWDLIIHRK